MAHYDLEQLAAVRLYVDFSFSPDGRSVAYTTDASGQFDVWRQPVDPCPEGGPQMPVQLTAFREQAAFQLLWSPDGSRIVTNADHEGDENYQLYEIPADRGWHYPLTAEPDVRHEIGPFGGKQFSPDGRYLAYSSNARKRTDFDVVVRDMQSGEARPIFADVDRNFPVSWSPDGRYLLIQRLTQNVDQDLFLCDLQTRDCRHLTPHEGDVKHHPGAWHPDGSGFYLMTDKEREFTGLAFFDVRDDSVRWIETPDWNVGAVDISHDGRYLAWTVSEDGYSRLYVRDLATGAVKDFPNLPGGVYSAMRFNPARNILGMIVSSPVEPRNLYMLDVESGAAWKLTQAFLGGIDPEEMVQPEVVRFPTFDGRMVPAFLYRPRGLAPGERVPVVLSIHGGPEATELPEYAYKGFYQYLLNRKIGVLAPNIRGSSGYGKTYQKLIYRDWGGGDLKDLEACARYLRDLDWADPARLGVFGGSFGGFATLSCATRLPEYWAVAVDICGPSNLITFAETVPPIWHRRRKGWVGDPVEDAAMLRERSPITYVDDIRAPLLVIQGANDPRVKKAESDQMVERLQSLGRTVEYVVFEDEGHGFSKPANWFKVIALSAGWLEKYLE